ncbi:DUF5133 domain-containing protein [Streptomyces sp. NPDC091265]|uniref:DUF5133 domain-containing protein n=1 Tax=unclassified Streptomyces TaxID=2593676 RepID=UPI0034509E02
MALLLPTPGDLRAALSRYADAVIEDECRSTLDTVRRREDTAYTLCVMTGVNDIRGPWPRTMHSFGRARLPRQPRSELPGGCRSARADPLARPGSTPDGPGSSSGLPDPCARSCGRRDRRFPRRTAGGRQAPSVVRRRHCVSHSPPGRAQASRTGRLPRDRTGTGGATQANKSDTSSRFDTLRSGLVGLTGLLFAVLV